MKDVEGVLPSIASKVTLSWLPISFAETFFMLEFKKIFKFDRKSLPSLGKFLWGAFVTLPLGLIFELIECIPLVGNIFYGLHEAIKLRKANQNPSLTLSKSVKIAFGRDQGGCSVSAKDYRERHMEIILGKRLDRLVLNLILFPFKVVAWLFIGPLRPFFWGPLRLIHRKWRERKGGKITESVSTKSTHRPSGQFASPSNQGLTTEPAAPSPQTGEVGSDYGAQENLSDPAAVRAFVAKVSDDIGESEVISTSANLSILQVTAGYIEKFQVAFNAINKIRSEGQSSQPSKDMSTAIATLKLETSGVLEGIEHVLNGNFTLDVKVQEQFGLQRQQLQTIIDGLENKPALQSKNGGLSG